MMDPEIKADWLTKLRSGYYKKGEGQLYQPHNNTYCCLGVLAVSCGITFLRDDDVTPDDPLYNYNFVYETGITKDEAMLLWQENDGNASGRTDATRSFADTADWIEENL